jgi:hypothetical protein
MLLTYLVSGIGLVDVIVYAVLLVYSHYHYTMALTRYSVHDSTTINNDVYAKKSI